MATVRTMQRSFGGGEVTPEYYGKIGDVYYETGLATCRNFMIKPHGPAINRPGTKYVRTVKNPAVATRLIRFAYSSTQTMAIEVGAGYFRFHTNGAALLQGTPAAWSGATAYIVGDLVASGGTNYYCILAHTNQAPPNATYWYAQPATGEYEIPNSYSAVDLFSIKYTQSSDVMTLAHQNYKPMELRRYGATRWTFVPVSFAPALTPPATVTVTGNAKGTDYFYQYLVTALSADGLTQSVASLPAGGAVGSSITGITNANPGVVTTSAAHGLAAGATVYISGVIGMTQVNGNYYLVSAPASTTFALQSLAGVNIDTTSYGAYAGGSATTRTNSSITRANPGLVTTTVAHGYVVGQFITFAGTQSNQLNTKTFIVGTVPTSTTFTINDSTNAPFDTSFIDTSQPGTTTGLGGGTVAPAGVKNNLFVTGGVNTITWSAVAGAASYNVYKFSGGVYGLIGSSQGTSFADNNIAADIGHTPPLYDLQ
ncbi:MAG: hypothetical protein M3O36_07465, partial [Myxococcota bacterium]|nr:hypothetical protein [Myxococcota bacterium]